MKKIRFIFTYHSFTTSIDNIIECYLNKTFDGDYYRISVKDKNDVEFTYYKADEVMFYFMVEEKTIFEGDKDDIPRIVIRTS